MNISCNECCVVSQKSAQAAGDEGAAAAWLPGPEKAAGEGTGVLQEVVAEKTGKSLSSSSFLGH